MGNCSSMLTKQCLGLSDPRYDQKSSNNILDQGRLWKEYSGYWGPFVELRNILSENNTPRKPSFYNQTEKAGWPYEGGVFTSYRLVAIEGTRFKSSKFYFYHPAPGDFCSQTPPDGLRNTIDPNQVCGEHGNVQVIEEFGTTTFEKDGTVNLIWVNIGPDSDESSGVPSIETRMSIVDDNAIFTYVSQPGMFTYSITETFYGEDYDYLIGVGTGASASPDSPNFQRQSGSLSGPKLNSEDSFLSALKKAYEDHKVPDIPTWITNGEGIPGCLSEQWGSCPTEQDWCSNMDPSCNVSVYQEPAASLNGFGITLASFLVLSFIIFGACLLKRFIAVKQLKRCRSHFAKVITERIGHTGHLSQLGAKDLEEEFKRIDIGLQKNDGMIQKDELWTWISSGKAGIMKKEDFDTLFNSMDMNGDGEVSFIEFCGFMARCGSEYDKEAEALLACPKKVDQIRGITRMVSMKKVD